MCQLLGSEDIILRHAILQLHPVQQVSSASTSSKSVVHPVGRVDITGDIDFPSWSCEAHSAN